MKKYFVIKVSLLVDVPYEEGLLDDRINKNHLMYLGCADIQKRGFDPAKAIYEITLREEDDAGKSITNQKI